MLETFLLRYFLSRFLALFNINNDEAIDDEIFKNENDDEISKDENDDETLRNRRARVR